MKYTFKKIATWAAMAAGFVVLPPVMTMALMFATRPVVGAWDAGSRGGVLFSIYLAEVFIALAVLVYEAY